MALAEMRERTGDAPAAETPAADLDTIPKLLLDHAARRGSRPALREKDYGIWQSWSWAESARRDRRFRSGLGRAGFQARRQAGGDRRQPAAALLGDHRGAMPGRRAGAGLSGCGSIRDAVRARPCRGALRRGRGPGAGRQAPVGQGQAAAARSHRVRRFTRPAPLRPARSAVLRGCPPERPRLRRRA